MWQNEPMSSAPKPPTGPLSEAVAGILRAERGRLGDVSLKDLGDAAGISRQQVGLILRGEKQVDVEELDRLCYALGLQLVDVIRNAEAVNTAQSRKVQASWRAVRLRTSDLVDG